jgi:hypothetical protein
VAGQKHLESLDTRGPIVMTKLVQDA